jgi:hypothetical protein
VTGSPHIPLRSRSSSHHSNEFASKARIRLS